MGGILAEPVFIHKNYAGSPIAATQFEYGILKDVY
jgi:hypothetical protein